MKRSYIYTLSCPITNVVRYIGKSTNPKGRLVKHLNLKELSDSTKKNNWLVSLLRKGLNPILDIIDESDIDMINDLEIYWISQFKSWGFELTNGTDGGDGFDWTGRKHKEESKLKLKINHPLRKCVGKFDSQGNLINRYLSTHEAAESNNLNRSSISKCCKGIAHICGGFKWAYIEDFSSEIVSIEKPKERKLEIDKPRLLFDRKKVIQYDLLGNIIQIFDYPQQACNTTKIHRTLITKCCEEKSHYTCKLKDGTDNRCTFRYEGDEFDYVPFNKYIQPTNKKVGKYDLDNNLISVYNSVNDAARQNNISQNNLTNDLKNPIRKDGKLRITKGYNYKLLD